MEKNRLMDGLAALVNDASATAKDISKEAQNLFSSQIEKALLKLDIVKAEDFEILKVMVHNLLEENNSLKKRVEKLEESSIK